MCWLTIVCATSRPNLTPILVQQILNQQTNIEYEALIVQEHNFRTPEPQDSRIKYYRKEQEGKAGAYGKDFGVQHASGQYVCFWDDDNWYYSDAINKIFRTADGYDAGIYRTEHYTPEYSISIPRTEYFIEPKYGDIDTMCFCVKRDVAKFVSWSQFETPGTDFKWINKVLSLCHKVNYSHDCIGKHFYCEQADKHTEDTA